jgi:transcriptional regulator with GAF, ATPase, and Fis domain
LNGLVGASDAMARCGTAIADASVSDVPVLITGETGTGKEVVARAIHKNSGRAKKSFVVVDCASLTETLVESSLFGHDRGAFTGASGERGGLVRQAHEGTLFLDEIGELPPSVQKAFLRVLQEKRFRPVGSDREASSDFRLLAATNRDLGRMVTEGTFREDLYFRLRSLEIALPPLRGRGQDVCIIARDVAAKTCARLGLPDKKLSVELCEALSAYSWPGNVRELKQAIECAVVTAGQAVALGPIHLPIQIRIQLARTAVKPELNRDSGGATRTDRGTLAAARDAAVSAYLAQLMREVRGDIDLACEIADVSRSRFYGLLKLYGIGRGAPHGASQGTPIEDSETAPMTALSCRFS